MKFPISHTSDTRLDYILDFAMALIPVYAWGVFAFGARVITLALVSVIFALLADSGIRSALKKKPVLPDGLTAVYALLAACTLPVSAPLWLPAVSGAVVAVGVNIRYRSRTVFNPYFLSAAAVNVAFSDLTAVFTRPFAYFSAFDFTVDERLIEKYRVVSPLQYIADGSVYEDGVIPQFFGNAAGNIGEIAVIPMLIALGWLFLKKRTSLVSTVSYLVPILLLALLFPSADAESEYYAYSVLLSGAIAFTATFAMNESHTVPTTLLGRTVFGVACGIGTFLFRKISGGVESTYLVILIFNALTPIIEKFTAPRPKGKINEK